MRSRWLSGEGVGEGERERIVGGGGRDTCSYIPCLFWDVSAILEYTEIILVAEAMQLLLRD